VEKRPEGMRISKLELEPEERAALSRLAGTAETRAAIRALTNLVWRMRESCDSCDAHELAKIQGVIMALKQVVSILSGEGSNERDDTDE
jgi:hypothetical protein